MIDAELLAVMQKFRISQIPPMSKGKYPFTNLGLIDPIIGFSTARERGSSTGSQLQKICWHCYAKVHMATYCPLDYDTRGKEVISNYELITFEEMGRFRPARTSA